MTSSDRRPMTLDVFLRLGRLANLPTIWTQVIAAAFLACACLGTTTPALVPLVLTAIACSCAYVGGMFLNDVLDRGFDARHRPDRPLPAGEIAPGLAMRWAAGLLLAPGALVAWAAASLGGDIHLAVLASGAMVLAIVRYDLRHRGDAWSPAIMALCRVGVYTTTMAVFLGATATPDNRVLAASLPEPRSAFALVCGVIFVHVLALTRVAHHERGPESVPIPAWPRLVTYLAVAALCLLPRLVGGTALNPVFLAIFAATGLWLHRAFAWLTPERGVCIGPCVVALIAALSFIDALVLAALGQTWAALGVLALLGVTRALQARIRGD